MQRMEKLLFSHLFLKGSPSKKETLMKHLSLSKEELDSLTKNLRTALETLPVTMLENEIELELVLTKEMTEELAPFIKTEKEGTLTPAALQTLTIVAYLDNPSAFDISYVRGVASNQSIAQLIARNLIVEISEKKYTLTTEALTHLGIQKKDELPDYLETREKFLEKIQDAIV